MPASTLTNVTNEQHPTPATTDSVTTDSATTHSTSGADAVETPAQRRAAMIAVTVLPIVVVIAGLWGYNSPSTFTSHASWVPYLLGVIMFCMGLTLTIPVKVYDPSAGAGAPRVLTVTIDQSTGRIAAGTAR